MEFPGEPVDGDERARIAAQLGRDPRGDVAVAVRCSFGLPAVIRTSPRLDDGTPFPTLYYLACPMAVRAVGRQEAAGAMVAYNADLAADRDLAAAYAAAHERYRAQRDAIMPLGDTQTAGGMPDRVKCLHALYAHELADGNPIGARVRRDVEPLGCPAPCVEEREGVAGRVAGHPGYAGKKRRR